MARIEREPIHIFYQTNDKFKYTMISQYNHVYMLGENQTFGFHVSSTK